MASLRRLSATVVLCSLVVGACATDSGPMRGTVEDLKAVRMRNFNIRKSINKAVGRASGAIANGFDQSGGLIPVAFSEAAIEASQAGRTAMSSVVDATDNAWRDAQGRVIDAAGNLVSSIPLTWPSDIGPKAAGQAVNAAKAQINAGLTALDELGESLLGVSAAVAEQRINDALSSVDVSFPKMSIPGVGQAYVPAKNPLYVRIHQSQWESANAANVRLDLDFFGLMRYRIGVGCIGFPNGFTDAPKIALNGGCDNPWKLLANKKMVADAAKGVVDVISQQITALQPMILGLIQSAAREAKNPRSIPPLLIDLPVNELLSMCCSLGFPSSKTKKAQTNASNGSTAGNSDAAGAIGSMAKNAVLSFTVPGLEGVTFSLSPDLSPVVVVDTRWTKSGQLEFAVELGFFGLFVASVGMGCMTFGTTWSKAPSLSFAGGCDKSWNVTFNAGGYTSSSVRLDARVENGSSAPPPVAPPPPPLPVMAPPGIYAEGGTVSERVLKFMGQENTYRIHVFTLDSENDFVVPREMENVPMRYLIVGGGGAGSSGGSTIATGSGGGGGGGVLSNQSAALLYLAAGTYQIIVGAGGTASDKSGDGMSGGNSSIGGTGLVALGGGGGGSINKPGRNGGSGGGGGFGTTFNSGGKGEPGQGLGGGLGVNGCRDNVCSAGGGGGGNAGIGAAAGLALGGDGGPGSQFNFQYRLTGKTVWYGAGGGGGGNSRGGKGGSPGAGAGGTRDAAGGDAAADTGSGGGGGGYGNNSARRAGSGGSGIVIILYRVK